MALKYRMVALVAVLLIGVACGGDGGSTTDAAADEGGGGSGGATLTTANFAFAPASLTAAAGDEIQFVNEDDAKHNITAKDADLDVDVDAGASTTIDLTGVEPGSYDFFCEYHKDSMTGTLEVTN